MRSCSKTSVELRRARPLLGTLVELRVRAPTPALAGRAVRAAFAAVARVQALMSFHEPLSDVSRLNRTAADRPVRVDPRTHRVLRQAQALHRATGGLFDVATAPPLVRAGWLPHGTAPLPATAGSAADIVLLPGSRVRFRRPLLIDLGGIAKGFAVDQAVAALRRHGARAGLVNAGGDLRSFGAWRAPVQARRPEAPGEFVHLVRLRDSALATSAPYYAARRVGGRLCAPVIDPRTGRPSAANLSVSVQARTCCLADALCKAVWLAGPAAAAPMLRRHRARAWWLPAPGSAAPPARSRHAA
ncbi:MAG: FAD:protein FMN transferase [Opitutae bacterium]|nr:FAD:protein FMN transferase [Opitutae bacterium]